MIRSSKLMTRSEECEMRNTGMRSAESGVNSKTSSCPKASTLESVRDQDSEEPLGNDNEAACRFGSAACQACTCRTCEMTVRDA